MDEFIEREMIALVPRLRRFALAKTGSGAEADDLVQMTCERAIRNLDKWERGTSLASWMFRIAQNLHLNGIRDGRTRQKYYDSYELDAEASSDGEAAAVAHSTLKSVQVAMQRLPEEQRAVLALVAIEGLSYREAADVLEVPIGTVTSRVSRAREALVALLASGGGREGAV